MQIFTVCMFLEAMKTAHEIASALTVTLYHAVFANIAISFHDIFTAHHPLTSLFLLIGSIHLLIRLIRSHTFDFIRVLFQ